MKLKALVLASVLMFQTQFVNANPADGVGEAMKVMLSIGVSASVLAVVATGFAVNNSLAANNRQQQAEVSIQSLAALLSNEIGSVSATQLARRVAECPLRLNKADYGIEANDTVANSYVDTYNSRQSIFCGE